MTRRQTKSGLKNEQDLFGILLKFEDRQDDFEGSGTDKDIHSYNIIT